MNKILLIVIVVIALIVLSVIAYFVIVNMQKSSQETPQTTSQEIPQTTSQEIPQTTSQEIPQTTSQEIPKCPSPDDNKDENYIFQNIPKLGSEILKTIKEKFSILLKKENFALSSTIVDDISNIDLNSYYYIGTRNASGDYPNCMLEIPFRVYKLVPTPV